MLLFSADAAKTSGCALLKSVLCLLVCLIAGGTCGNVRAEKISTTIRVCVTDESNRKVTEHLSLVLFNSPDKISSKSPDEDGCFKSAKLSLDTGGTYFVVAQKDDKLNFAELKLKPEDQSKVITSNLKLTGLVKSSTPGIEICLEDENKKHIPIKSLPPSDDGGDLTEEKARNADCARVKLGAANEYQLTLTAQSAIAERNTGVASRLPGIPALLLLLITIILFVNLGIFIEVKRIQGAKEVSSEAENIRNISGQMQELSQDVCTIKNKVEGWPEDFSLVSKTTAKSGDGEAETSTAEKPDSEDDLSPAAVDSSIEMSQPQTLPPITAASQLNNRMDEAKQKYSDFISGTPVDHFYLMPVGSSSANQMVEDEKVKLREQDHGTYIAFCPSNDAAEAWVFPLPGYHFTSETFSAVFPDLLAQEYESGNFDPKRAISIQPKLWKVEQSDYSQ